MPAEYVAQPIQPNLGENWPDWLCYLAGNFQTAPTIFFIFSAYLFLNNFIKNPQTRNACEFLTLDISPVGSVHSYTKPAPLLLSKNDPKN